MFRSVGCLRLIARPLDFLGGKFVPNFNSKKATYMVFKESVYVSFYSFIDRTLFSFNWLHTKIG